MKKRIFLIDDHAVLRQGLRLLIETQPDMEVVGDIGCARGAADEIRRAGGADVVVLDLSLPDASGPRAGADLLAALPSTRIVVLTRHSEKAYVQQMLQSGASGYILKQTAGEVLIAAIRTVCEGGVYLDPAVAGKMFDPRASARGGEDLTPREREVLMMVAHGHTNKEIAATLGITVKTVETHKANGMQKLEIASRADLVSYALTQGWMARPV